MRHTHISLSSWKEAESRQGGAPLAPARELRAPNAVASRSQKSLPASWARPYGGRRRAEARRRHGQERARGRGGVCVLLRAGLRPRPAPALVLQRSTTTLGSSLRTSPAPRTVCDIVVVGEHRLAFPVDCVSSLRAGRGRGGRSRPGPARLAARQQVCQGFGGPVRRSPGVHQPLQRWPARPTRPRLPLRPTATSRARRRRPDGRLLCAGARPAHGDCWGVGSLLAVREVDPHCGYQESSDRGRSALGGMDRHEGAGAP